MIFMKYFGILYVLHYVDSVGNKQALSEYTQQTTLTLIIKIQPL